MTFSYASSMALRMAILADWSTTLVNIYYHYLQELNEQISQTVSVSVCISVFVAVGKN